MEIFFSFLFFFMTKQNSLFGRCVLRRGYSIVSKSVGCLEEKAYLITSAINVTIYLGGKKRNKKNHLTNSLELTVNNRMLRFDYGY